MGLTLEVSDIGKRYGGRPALTACSVSFPEGRVHAVMGPNGCGKSTLLRIAALLEPADSGAVSYRQDGTPCIPDMGLRRRISLVLPKVGIFNTSVLKNAEFGLSVRGIAQPARRKRAEEALHAVGLHHKRFDQALTLSSGETQRLGIARAIAVEPELLFLDEPCASIDEENTAIVEQIILRLKQSGRSTIIFTTHDREQAVRLADGMIFMRGGGIVGMEAP